MLATVTNISNRRESWPTLPDLVKNCPLTLEPGESAETEIPYDFAGHPKLRVQMDEPKPFAPVSVSSTVPSAAKPSDSEDQE